MKKDNWVLDHITHSIEIDPVLKEVEYGIWINKDTFEIKKVKVQDIKSKCQKVT